MKKALLILAIVGIPIITIFGYCLVKSNQDNSLRNRFTREYTNRTAFYDNMWKTVKQKSQITLRNDSSFERNVNVIMSGRKDAEGTAMKWIQESNPNANYSEVSALYKDLSRTIESKRDEFFVLEKTLSDIKNEDDNLLTNTPSKWLLVTFMNRKPISYKPITSDKTDAVIKAGKDNDTQVF